MPETPFERRACPNCNDGRGVRIAYGMPGPDLFEAAERGEIALGGCVISGDDPEWRCLACGYEWGTRRVRR